VSRWKMGALSGVGGDEAVWKNGPSGHDLNRRQRKYGGNLKSTTSKMKKAQKEVRKGVERSVYPRTAAGKRTTTTKNQ